MNIRIRQFSIFFITLSIFVLPFFVLAGNPPQPPSSGYNILIPNPLVGGTNNLYSFISLVINNVLMPLGGVIVVIYIIYSGFLFVTARGNETKLATAKRAFMYAVIGTAILLGAWAISLAIKATIGQITNP